MAADFQGPATHPSTGVGGRPGTGVGGRRSALRRPGRRPTGAVGRRRAAHLTGRRVLVTGAASGIGRAVAELCGRRGARLVLTDIDEPGLTATAEAIRAAGGTVEAATAVDLTDFAAVRAFGAEVHRDRGPVDVVLNVAGTSAWGTVQHFPHELWRAMVDVNLMGPVHVIEVFVPPMIEAGRGGHLVNVSSAAGLFGLPGHAAYSAAKFGLRGVSEVLRFDLRPHGIEVSLVCPGAVDTPLVHRLQVAGVDQNSPSFQRARERFRARAVTPEHAAAAILRGMRRGRYLIYTSRDIRFLHWVQRTWSWPYERVMAVLNTAFRRQLADAGSPR